MSKITKGTIIVPITQVSPNDFNPKPDFQSTPALVEKFEKLKNSLEYHGQEGALLVRKLKKDKYEIIDGEHRYYAMKELGFEEVEIKDLGELTREEAIKKLFSSELKFEVDPVAEAQLLKELKQLDINLDGLPFTPKEIDMKIALLDFKFEGVEENNGEDKKPKEVTCPACGEIFKP